MTTLAVATPHALVLTVSHGCFSANPLICGDTRAAASLNLKSCIEFHHAISLSNAAPPEGFAAILRNSRYARHSRMRAAPIKLLGLNLAIRLPSDPAFAVPVFATPSLRCQTSGRVAPLKGTLLAFKAARHNHLRPIPLPQASRFRPIFQVLFCCFFAEDKCRMLMAQACLTRVSQ